jgi:O-antigen/teichoic acid export membrane protein
MTPLRRIARSSAAFLGSSFARAALGFGLSLVVGRGLGANRFGQWVLCTAWASLLTVVADLGFGVLLTRDGARANAPVTHLVAGALIARLAVVVPLAAALYAGAAWIATDAGSIAALRVAALLGIVSAAYGCFSAILISQPRWLPIVLGVETAWLAVQVAASWWLVGTAWSPGSGGLVGFGSGGSGGLVGWVTGVSGSDGKVVALIALATFVQLAQIATALVLWRRVFADRAATRSRREPPGALLRRALPFAGAGIVANLDLRVAPLMLGALSTSSAVGLYAAASRFGRFAAMAPQALFGGALPVLSGEFERDRVLANRLFRKLDRGLLAFGALTAAGYLVLAPFLLRVAYGPSFVAAAPALMWIGLGLIPSLSNSGRKIALYAAGGEAAVVHWSAVALIVQVGSAAALIPVLGSTGAAIGVFIGEAAVWLPLRRANAAAAEADLRFDGTAYGGAPL